MHEGLFAYGRVSSEEQAENQHAAEQQYSRLLQAGVPKSHVFFDVESGQSDSRQEFAKLLELIKAGKVKELIATRWDRLSRNFAIYHQLKELLQLKQVTLRLLDQGEVDFESAAGELSADMQALLAVHEVRLLSERVSKGHRYRRDRKASFGRPPWGYRVVNEKFKVEDRPIICLLEQQPDDPTSFIDLEDDDPRLVPGISKGSIAREAIELFLELHRPRAVLQKLAQKYGVQRKHHVVRRKKTAADISTLLADRGHTEQLADDPEDAAERAALDEILGERPTRKDKDLKQIDLSTSTELLLFRQASSFNEWLRNPVLRGHIAYGKYARKTGKALPADQWQLHYDTHPDQRLIHSDEEYADILALLANNHRHVGTPQKTYYLTGLIFCDRCGHRMSLKNSPNYR